MTYEEVKAWWLSQPEARIVPQYRDGYFSGVLQFRKGDEWVASLWESRSAVRCVNRRGCRNWHSGDAAFLREVLSGEGVIQDTADVLVMQNGSLLCCPGSAVTYIP